MSDFTKAFVIFACIIGLGAAGVKAVPVITAAMAGHSGVTAVGPGFVDSFKVTCSKSTATKIGASGQVAYSCQNTTTNAVHVGDDGLTTTTAPKYCDTNCPSQEFGGDVRREYCLSGVDAGVDITCRAMVTQEP